MKIQDYILTIFIIVSTVAFKDNGLNAQKKLHQVIEKEMISFELGLSPNPSVQYKNSITIKYKGEEIVLNTGLTSIDSVVASYIDDHHLNLVLINHRNNKPYVLAATSFEGKWYQELYDINLLPAFSKISSFEKSKIQQGLKKYDRLLTHIEFIDGSTVLAKFRNIQDDIEENSGVSLLRITNEGIIEYSHDRYIHRQFWGSDKSLYYKLRKDY